MLKKHGHETWFNIGDKDFATHIYRSNRLKQGISLCQITAEISQSFGIRAKILPMTNDKFETTIETRSGLLHFEEYLVKQQAKYEVLGVQFIGKDTAKPTSGVLEAISEAELVVLCPSNPIVSIGTILTVKGVREALRKTNARIVGVSPIVAGVPIKGPADKLLRGLGFEVSAYSVAKLYSDFLDDFIVDIKDASLVSKIQQLGVNVEVTNTIMMTLEDKVALASTVLGLQ